MAPFCFRVSAFPAYEEALQKLRAQGLIYDCDCTRLQIHAMGGVYDNRCRNRTDSVTAGAERMQVSDSTVFFTDAILGPQQQHLLQQCGDFILRRKDGLIAYQLAVVVDDAFQNITDIVRGSDLLDSPLPGKFTCNRNWVFRHPAMLTFLWPRMSSDRN